MTSTMTPRRRWRVLGLLFAAIATFTIPQAAVAAPLPFTAKSVVSGVKADTIPNPLLNPQPEGGSGGGGDDCKFFPHKYSLRPEPENFAVCQSTNALSAAGKFLDWVLNNPVTRISSSQWDVAFGQAAKWAGLMAPIAVALCAIEILQGVASRNGARIKMAALLALGSWPITVIALLLFGRLIAIGDWVSTQILTDAASNLSADQLDLLGLSSISAGGTIAALIGASLATVIGTGGTFVIALVAIALLGFAAILCLTLVLAAVTYGQILLATFAPVAFMAISFKPARKMVSKWATTAVSLMLIKPIVAGIIGLNLRLILDAGGAGFIIGTAGMLLAALSPMAVLQFVGFTGAQLGAAMGAIGAMKKAAHRGKDQASKEAKRQAKEKEQQAMRDITQATSLQPKSNPVGNAINPHTNDPESLVPESGSATEETGNENPTLDDQKFDGSSEAPIEAPFPTPAETEWGGAEGADGEFAMAAVAAHAGAGGPDGHQPTRVSVRPNQSSGSLGGSQRLGSNQPLGGNQPLGSNQPLGGNQPHSAGLEQTEPATQAADHAAALARARQILDTPQTDTTGRSSISAPNAETDPSPTETATSETGATKPVPSPAQPAQRTENLRKVKPSVKASLAAGSFDRFQKNAVQKAVEAQDEYNAAAQLGDKSGMEKAAGKRDFQQALAEHWGSRAEGYRLQADAQELLEGVAVHPDLREPLAQAATSQQSYEDAYREGYNSSGFRPYSDDHQQSRADVVNLMAANEVLQTVGDPQVTAPVQQAVSAQHATGQTLLAAQAALAKNPNDRGAQQRVQSAQVAHNNARQRLSGVVQQHRQSAPTQNPAARANPVGRGKIDALYAHAPNIVREARSTATTRPTNELGRITPIKIPASQAIYTGYQG